MMRRLLALLAVLALLATPASAEAQKKRSSSKKSTSASSGSNKPVHVRPYTKKDGTSVAAHDRAPAHKKSGTSTSTTAAKPKAATTTRPLPPKPHAAATNPSVARTSDGRIERSEAAKAQFMRQTGYPHGRPGYVVDHIRALACGGADAPSNMQWQTVANAKAKDKVERIGCR